VQRAVESLEGLPRALVIGANEDQLGVEQVRDRRAVGREERVVDEADGVRQERADLAGDCARKDRRDNRHGDLTSNSAGHVGDRGDGPHQRVVVEVTPFGGQRHGPVESSLVRGLDRDEDQLGMLDQVCHRRQLEPMPEEQLASGGLVVGARTARRNPLAHLRVAVPASDVVTPARHRERHG
jgi:hypothetical protein